MNRVESETPLVIGFGGGGSTGNTTMGFIEAVDAGLVEGVTEVEAFAFVGTADDGSSTGRLRALYGTPAVGDLRRSISALSANQDAAQDFERRLNEDATPQTVAVRAEQLLATLSYTDAPHLPSDRAAEIMKSAVALSSDIYDRDPARLNGLALGHLVITALTLEKGIDTASHETGQLMAARAEVIPVSTVPHFLKMQDGDTTTLLGEHKIDIHEINHPEDVTVSLYTNPDGSSQGVPLNPRVRRAIDRADKVVIGPGSVYTSIVPALLPDGMKQALAKMQAEGRPLTLVGNIATQRTETEGWKGEKYIREIEKYTDRKVDEVIYNQDTDGVSDAVVFDRDTLTQMGDYRIVATNLVKREQIIRDPNDPLKDQRSEVAHDMRAVAVALLSGRALSNNNEFAIA